MIDRLTRRVLGQLSSRDVVDDAESRDVFEAAKDVDFVRPLRELSLGGVRVADEKGLRAFEEILLVLNGKLQGRGDLL